MGRETSKSSKRKKPKKKKTKKKKKPKKKKKKPKKVFCKIVQNLVDLHADFARFCTFLQNFKNADLAFFRFFLDPDIFLHNCAKFCTITYNFHAQFSKILQKMTKFTVQFSGSL